MSVVDIVRQKKIIVQFMSVILAHQFRAQQQGGGSLQHPRA